MRSAESKRLDMLHGPIWSKLPQFALPVAATAILEQLFNASDIAVVGNFTGADKTIAVAAVGANSALIALIVNLFIGIALGVCGIRIAWIHFAFPQHPTLQTIMTSYPVSLSATALMIFIALLCYRPARKHAAMEREPAPAGK